MRELITTAAEILGATFVATGVGIIFGLGASLIIAGVFLIAGSYLYASAVSE